MKTGKKTPDHSGKHTRKPRFSGKFLVLLVSALVLSAAMVGGTLAWLAEDTGPVTNTLHMPQTDIGIVEDFDGSVKENIRVQNTGDVPVYVRARLVVNLRDAQGNVVPIDHPQDYYSIAYTGGGSWVGSGIFYCTQPLAPGEISPNLVDSITGDTPYTLSVQVLAQSVQAQGTRDGIPMVEALGWPVKVQPDGSLKLN